MSEKNQFLEDITGNTTDTDCLSLSEDRSGDEKLDYSFSNETFDEDDREFEAGQVLETNKLPSTASTADKKLRANWARNLSYMIEKIDKYERVGKKVRKEASKRRKRLSRVLKQLGKLQVRHHYPGTRPNHTALTLKSLRCVVS